ncbi:hypothetical protein HT031_003920 [Scenedesmus sp. PABB004]|nr:hypothetical protein HT031_003920 [Scenedesmus sp. PABB004]
MADAVQQQPHDQQQPPGLGALLGQGLASLDGLAGARLGTAAAQHAAAVAALAAALALVLATIAAGWLTLWHTTLKDVGFFREVMGLNRPKPDVKAARQATIAAEIERIKRQHSRGAARSRHQAAAAAAAAATPAGS